MVPIANKPTAQHILDLLARHGIDDVIMTVAFLPQLIRNHFGDGSSLGMHIEYSVEETPLGTAGSVKNAQSALDDTFIVISGDALTDFDLTAIIDFHRTRESLVTIALKSVENPLEFGVVIVDEEGRIERFLEKPGWGQVFSDTINTGIYVLEPQVLNHIPAGEPYDFSHQLFPRLFEQRKPLYGVLCDGYWQDVGSLEQYLEANRDALDGKVNLQIPGVRLRGNVWVGQGVSLDTLDNVAGPAVIGNYAKIDPSAVIGPHTVLGTNVVVRAGAHVADAVVGDNSYLGSGSRVTGAVLGNSVDVRANAVIAAGAVVGDQSSVGEGAIVGNNVKVYPFKVIEAGSSVKTSLISETRGASTLFGRYGVRGLINVDITPETAVRLAMSYGTLLSKDAVVTASRDPHPASRVLKRAVIAGLNATGVAVRDLRVAPITLNRFDLRTGEAAGGVHVRISLDSPEEVEILFAEPPGVPIGPTTERTIENYYHREDFRRALHNEMGSIAFPPRIVEIYMSALLEQWDRPLIRERGLRVVVDYAHSGATFLVAGVLDRLEVEAVTVNSPPAHEIVRAEGDADETNDDRHIARVRRVVAAMEADLGIVLGASGESLVVVDETGARVPDVTMLLLLIGHAGKRGEHGSIALPLHITRWADAIAAESELGVVRTKISEASLMAEAARPHMVFAGALGGRYIYPAFMPSPDAVLSFGKVLELVAAGKRPLSELAAAMPAVHVEHSVVPCPWHVKGAVMRRMVEDLKHERLSLVDGIKVSIGKEDWVQIVPDADDPVFHVFAEASTGDAARELLETYRGRLRVVVEERESEEG
jgi:mannose-1-phosphate guanylyltransferase/phosphomannomutase